jgi:hypothetical protein
MTLPHYVLLPALLLFCAQANAGDIRHIQPERNSMLPPADATGAPKAQAGHGIKPASEDVPSPILVERIATVDGAGRLGFGCAGARTHDFRKLRAAIPHAATEPSR